MGCFCNNARRGQWGLIHFHNLEFPTFASHNNLFLPLIDVLYFRDNAWWETSLSLHIIYMERHSSTCMLSATMTPTKAMFLRAQTPWGSLWPTCWIDHISPRKVLGSLHICRITHEESPDVQLWDPQLLDSPWVWLGHLNSLNKRQRLWHA
jgi:hypothetical protein